MAEQSAAIKPTSVVDQFESTAPAEDISRPTEELVIGMVGAVGAGVSRSALELKSILETDYGYSVEILKASDLIRENASKTAKTSPAKAGSDRIKDLQAVGTDLRNSFGEDYIAVE